MNLQNIEKLDFKNPLILCGDRQNPCGICFCCKASKIKPENVTSLLVPNEGDMMIVVVDEDKKQNYLRGSPESFHMVIEAVKILCEKHLTKRPENDVVIFGCSKSGVHQVFSAQQHYVKGIWEGVQQDLLAGLKANLNENLDTTTQEPAESHQRTQLLQSVGRSLAYITAKRRAIEMPVNAKIILVSGSNLPDGCSYFFGMVLGYAKSMSVKIDVFSIVSPMKPALLLAANMTGGKYIDFRKVEGLTENIKSLY